MTAPHVIRTLCTWASGVAALLGCMAAYAQSPAGEPQRLETIPLQAGMHVIRAAIAASPEQRQLGLMHRRDMPVNEGMLFVFEAPSVQCFWMRNTPLALSIAFLADDGTVVNVADMQPFNDASHCSTKPVRLALEMHQGWFAKRAIKSGSRLKGAPFQP